ncbi:DUF6010 family protein [Streptomyces europaeiscabiei]|uniref:DUF6010 family protein n=1 Tax=Streptomyces europaeiscabiei TaxID=146819 RepID=UPI0029C03A1C|nr:DUF6010 family protein [Streptomyces europaeiscabiei]
MPTTRCNLSAAPPGAVGRVPGGGGRPWRSGAVRAAGSGRSRRWSPRSPARGPASWTFIGVGPPVHTAWDVVHDLKGSPPVPFLHDSSLVRVLSRPGHRRVVTGRGAGPRVICSGSPG